jgi:uncharacterized protein (TIGR02147 family)
LENSIFDYLDYRDYVADHFKHNKSHHSYFSYRYISMKTSLDPGFYVKIIQKQKHIADKTIDILSKFFEFDPKEAEYFRILVQFNKAKKPEHEKLYFEKLQSFKLPDAKILDWSKYDYFLKWYTIAIREEINTIPFDGDYDDLARRFVPQISAEEARETVALLEKLNLIRRKDDNKYAIVDSFVASDGSIKTFAIREFQKQMCRLGMESIDRIQKDERDISTLTISTSKKCLEVIKEKLATVRKEIVDIIGKEETVEEVYQINFQIFPLTRNSKGDVQ